jgi:hypothetical protein
MITKDNLKAVFDNLNKSQIEEAMNYDSDYVYFGVSSFGSYFVNKVPNDDLLEIQSDAEAEGNLVCDKDDFLRLFKESDSLNPWLIQLM